MHEHPTGALVVQTVWFVSTMIHQTGRHLLSHVIHGNLPQMRTERFQMRLQGDSGGIGRQKSELLVVSAAQTLEIW